MSDKKKNILFIAYTYAFFWVMVHLMEVLVNVMQSGGIVSQLMLLVGGWAPTIALLMLFRKLFSDNTVKRFF